jgi:hypothetical protein
VRPADSGPPKDLNLIQTNLNFIQIRFDPKGTLPSSKILNKNTLG